MGKFVTLMVRTYVSPTLTCLGSISMGCVHKASLMV